MSYSKSVTEDFTALIGSVRNMPEHSLLHISRDSQGFGIKSIPATTCSHLQSPATTCKHLHVAESTCNHMQAPTSTCMPPYLHKA